MSIEWAGWLVAFLVALAMFIWRIFEQLSDKKFINCWVEKTLPNGVKTFSEEKEYIGEYKSESIDDLREGYIIKVRKGTKIQELKSPINSVDLFKTYCDKTFAKIWKCLDVLKFDEVLPEEDWYKKKLELSRGAKLYLFLNTFLLDFKSIPIFVHIFVFWIFWGLIFRGNLLVMPIGVGVVFLVNILNHHFWGPKCIKRREVQVKSETHLVPVESNIIEEDIYEVHFYKRQKVTLGDSTTAIQLVTWNPDNNEWINIDGLTQNQIDALKPTLMKATQVIDLELNPEATILSKKVVSVERRKVSIIEMKAQKRDYLSKNRYMWGQLQNARKHIRDKNLLIKDLYEQLAYVEATKNRDVKEMGDKMINEIKANGITLKEIYKELQTGEFIEENWEITLERINEKIDARGYGKLIKIIENIAEKQDKFENVMLKLITTQGGSTNHKNQEIIQDLLGYKAEKKKEEAATDV